MGEAAHSSAQRYAWPRVADQVTEVYERAIEAPRPAGAETAPPTGPASGPPTASPPPGAEASLARSGARLERQARTGGRPPRRPRRRRRPRNRPDRPRRAEDRRRQRGRKHRPLQPHLGPHRLRVDGGLTLLPRRLLVLDRPRGAPEPLRPSPRRHLGDDDRRADVGDAPGPPRRAGPRAWPSPAAPAGCARPSRFCSGPWSRRRCSTSLPWPCSG